MMKYMTKISTTLLIHIITIVGLQQKILTKVFLYHVITGTNDIDQNIDIDKLLYDIKASLKKCTQTNILQLFLIYLRDMIFQN